MRHEIIDAPNFGMLKVTFEATGETLVAESGAMVSMSTGLALKTQMRGGVMAAAKRKLLGGESLFQNTYTATQPGQELYLAPSAEGDLRQRTLGAGETFFLQSGAYLGHTGQGLVLDTKWAGVKSFFGGVGFFMLKITGPGDLWFNSYGALHEVRVGPEGYICDTGHIVGFTAGLEYDIRRFAGTKGLFFSGEGLVCHFRGSGSLFLQTRNASSLAAFLHPYRRVERSSS